MRLDGEILIAGAGIGGLALGGGLAQRGFACRVLERAPALAAVGAGILVQTAAMLALRTLGLDRAVAAAGREVRVGVVKTERGRMLQRTSLAFLGEELGVPTIALHRARLQEVLREGLGGATLELGAEVERYEVDEGGVTVLLRGGRRVRGALLVGADGLYSAVRRTLLGETPPRYSGYTSWRGIAEVGATPPEEVAEMWGPGARFGFAGIGKGEVYWFAVLNAKPGEREPNSLAVVRQHFASFADPVSALLASTPSERVFRTDIHDRVPVASWSRDRVTLLGDAAHPTTPNLGQGGCMAIEDAVTLAHALEHAPSFSAAFADYERKRVARTTRIVNASFRFGQLAQLENRLAIAVRNWLLRLTPEGVLERELRRAAEFSLEDGLARAPAR
jgi:2-polyprenyl-6-methoxyphenol hydroxylase-like FAD-dependent oxidoreductase